MKRWGLLFLLLLLLLPLGSGCRNSCLEGYELVSGSCQPADDDDTAPSDDDDTVLPDDDDDTVLPDDDDDDDDDTVPPDDDDVTPQPAEPVLAVVGPHFVDPEGGVVILRGLNLAGNSKVPPFLPLDPVTQLDLLDALPGWGVNVLRLVFTWEAYEPEKGVYDEDYLAVLTAVADAAWERGVYVILDFHQDGFSRYHAGGCGDGFPQWAAHPGASLDTPDNGLLCAAWAVAVAADPDVHDSFSHFYLDTTGVRTRYLELWGQLATHFADRPGVIGFDLMNEPWGWEASELGPLYEDAAVVIRAADPGAILFIEGHASTNNGVIQTLLPEPTFDNYVYSPHFYETSVIGTHLFTGLPTATDLAFWTMTGKAEEWNVPLFLGEFGAHADTINGAAYVDLQYERLDDHFASGAQWNWTPGWTEEDRDGWNHEDLSITDDSGELRSNFRVRAGPRRIAGLPLQFDTTNESVLLRWDSNPSAGATEIFLPADLLWETSSVATEVEGQVSCSYDPGLRLLSCTASETGEVSVLAGPG
ncbi:MAG: cellulase family glycosylhydrolase [Myxococcota bacterium]|nr:cellulase family glycosylhydrolase [Myxococcota bacterium]